MPKTITYNKPDRLNELEKLTNSAFELVNWSAPQPTSPSTFISSSSHSCNVNDNVLALQTTRLTPQQTLPLKINGQISTASSLNHRKIKNEELIDKTSPYGDFNLGLHVGDNATRVTHNRNELKQFINQQLLTNRVASDTTLVEEVKIQWLQQVHGTEVAIVTVVDEQAMIADASITTQKNVALAIMTADCLPILLSHKEGTEIAAIHGGWRPLAGNIIAKTIAKMHSNPAELVAWLGPCIGKDAFEVGSEVKQAFTQLDMTFNNAFLKQKNGKYLANLQQIARLQLESLGVTVIASLAACTYQETEKYYSYRKEQKTGRMASLICRR